MAKLQEAENWLQALLNTQTVEGIPVGEAPELVMAYFFGDLVRGPHGWFNTMAAGIVWFLCWSLIALRLDGAGRWKLALASYAVGYEATWTWVITMYLASGRMALYLLVLPLFGWTFTVVSALTGFLLWQHGVNKVIFGLPGLLITFAGRRGLLQYFGVTALRSSSTPCVNYVQTIIPSARTHQEGF